MSRQISHSVTVAASCAEIFELLADPSRHPELDGSGTVRDVRSAPQRLSLGARFGMTMRLGVPYLITNTVVEFEEARRIAWRHWGRHRWRWELEPTKGGCVVTETFDWSTALAPPALELAGVPERNDRAIRATLDRLVARYGDGQETVRSA